LGILKCYGQIRRKPVQDDLPNVRSQLGVSAPEIHFVAETSTDGRVTLISVHPNYGLFLKRIALFVLFSAIFYLGNRLGLI